MVVFSLSESLPKNLHFLFSVKLSDKSAKRTIKQQLIHEAKEAIDKTSFHALPLVTAEVASWFKVEHFLSRELSKLFFQFTCILYFIGASIIAFSATCIEVFMNKYFKNLLFIFWVLNRFTILSKPGQIQCPSLRFRTRVLSTPGSLSALQPSSIKLSIYN